MYGYQKENKNIVVLEKKCKLCALHYFISVDIDERAAVPGIFGS